MEYSKECTQEYKTDIIGKKFGLLVVKELVDIKRYPHRFRYFYRCVCECGNEKIVERTGLVGATTHTKSCGCMKRRTGNKNPTWRGHGEISAIVWNSIKILADRRDIAFDIDIKYAWDLFNEQGGKCALTGDVLSLRDIKSNGKYHMTKTASLDRIDSSMGYVKGNVQWVHKEINMMKIDLPESRFVELCKKVANYAG